MILKLQIVQIQETYKIAHFASHTDECFKRTVFIKCLLIKTTTKPYLPETACNVGQNNKSFAIDFSAVMTSPAVLWIV